MKTLLLAALSVAMGTVGLLSATAEKGHCEGPFMVTGMTATSDPNVTLLRLESPFGIRVKELRLSPDAAAWYVQHKSGGQEVYLCDGELMSPPPE